MSLYCSGGGSGAEWPEPSFCDSTMSVPAERPRVLLIDDEPINIEVLSSALSEDYVVAFATDGVKGLRLSRTPPPPEIILLDVMMEGMDGFAVFSRLKADPRTRRIPVIFLTALDDASNRERGIGMGAVDYIHKPFIAECVRDRVQMYIELSRARGYTSGPSSRA